MTLDTQTAGFVAAPDQCSAASTQHPDAGPVLAEIADKANAIRHLLNEAIASGDASGYLTVAAGDLVCLVGYMADRALAALGRSQSVGSIDDWCLSPRGQSGFAVLESALPARAAEGGAQ